VYAFFIGKKINPDFRNAVRGIAKESYEITSAESLLSAVSDCFMGIHPGYERSELEINSDQTISITADNLLTTARSTLIVLKAEPKSPVSEIALNNEKFTMQDHSKVLNGAFIEFTPVSDGYSTIRILNSGTEKYTVSFPGKGAVAQAIAFRALAVNTTIVVAGIGVLVVVLLVFVLVFHGLRKCIWKIECENEIVYVARRFGGKRGKRKVVTSKTSLVDVVKACDPEIDASRLSSVGGRRIILQKENLNIEKKDDSGKWAITDTARQSGDVADIGLFNFEFTKLKTRK
jgi:hypothetical protein